MAEQIEREQLIPAPPDQVWEVITGDGWLAEQVALELVPGGEARFDDRTGWVEEALPGERLVFWWSDDGEPASRVELTLEPAGEDGTRLRVLEARPLEMLEVIGMPAPGAGQADRGPMMLAA